MKVTFDTNVLGDFVLSTECFRIRDAVRDGSIIACVAETVFTLEAIKKENRKSFLSLYVGKTAFPKHPGNNKYLDLVLKAGVKILRCPRIAGLTNLSIPQEKYFNDLHELAIRQNLFSVCLEEIERRGCGIDCVQKLGAQYDRANWLRGIKIAPDLERTKVADAVGEWADGDSVAAHIAYRNDYFCSRDFNRNGSGESILSDKNRKWLFERYKVRFINMDDLKKMIP
jgi:hypothetical protein